MKASPRLLAVFLLQAAPAFSQGDCFYPDFSPPACPLTPTDKKYHCSSPGSVTPFAPKVSPGNPYGTGFTCLANSEADCSAECNLFGSTCKVYGYDTSTGTCSIFKYALKSKVFKKDPTSTVLFSRAGCATESRLITIGGINLEGNYPGSQLALQNYEQGQFSDAPAPTTVSLDDVAADDDCNAVKSCFNQLGTPASGSGAYVYFDQDSSTWQCDYWNGGLAGELSIGTINDPSVGQSYFYW